MLRPDRLRTLFGPLLRGPGARKPLPARSEAERQAAIFGQLKPAFARTEPGVPEAIVAREYGLDAHVVFDPAFALHPTCFELSIRDGRVAFRFSTAMSDDGLSIMIVERWWQIMPLIERLASVCGDRTIGTVVNLNDEGLTAGLAFCDNRPDMSLIPDCVFVGTKGYHEQRERYAARAVAWEDKRDVVFWRGTSTGRPSGEPQALPRIRLCRLCRSDSSGVFDTGLTGLVDHGADETARIEGQSLIADFVPWQEFDRYRYHIDIDGHTNSWPGLMFKLHSGGLVFKVDSPADHRQWYYDRLRAWETYVPVKSDLSDLFDLVAYVRRNQTLGRAIAAEGRRLALSMDFSSELDTGVRTILGRCAREHYAHDRT